MNDMCRVMHKSIFAAGPPRSGTTLLAQMLNSHPRITTSIDNSVWECWRLYYYRDRVGLIQSLREGTIEAEAVEPELLAYLTRDNSVSGIAHSKDVEHYPFAPRPVAPGTAIPASLGDHHLPRKIFSERALRVLTATARRLRPDSPPPARSNASLPLRYFVPCDRYGRDWFLCLKSPEIVFVIPELASAFPTARFVLVYRPIIEIAESMYRKGFEWALPSYHRRWSKELDADGSPLPPPGVQETGRKLWPHATNFQRCVIYAASYLMALLEGIGTIERTRFFLYRHGKLQSDYEHVIEEVAQFLELEADGFHPFAAQVRPDSLDPDTVPTNLRHEYEQIAKEIELEQIWSRLEAASSRSEQLNGR